MKKLYFSIILLISFIAHADGQVINNGEYFFDTDPGLGQGTPITITPNDTVSLSNIAVNTTGLINGYHFFYVRVKESIGTWSHCRRQRFYIYDNSPIVPVHDSVVLAQAEYWIDSLPVPGTGRLITLEPKDTLSYNDSIPGLQLDSGLHKVSVRVRDNKGNWSFAKTEDVRTEKYDIDVFVTHSPFVRSGQRMKHSFTIRNRGSTKLIDRSLILTINKPFEIEMLTMPDSIDGVYTKDISSVLSYPAINEYIAPIWLGSIEPHSDIHFDLYITYANFNRETIHLNYSIQGDNMNEFQQDFNENNSLDLINTSHLFTSQRDAILNSQDSLMLSPLVHYQLVDTMKSWYLTHNNLISKPCLIPQLMKPLLKYIYQSNVTNSLIQLVNLNTYFHYQDLSYADGNIENLVSTSQVRTAYSSITPPNDCECNTNLCLSSIFFPLPNDGCFDITSTCKLRCKCPCVSNKYKPTNQWHEGYDISFSRKDGCGPYLVDWNKSNMPVRAMFEGTTNVVNPEVTNENPNPLIFVEVTSQDDCGKTFITRYLHLSGKDLPNDNTHLNAGDLIGYASNSGAKQIHLHVEFKYPNGTDIPPSCVLGTLYPFRTSPSAYGDLTCLDLNNVKCEYKEDWAPCTENLPGLAESRKCPVTGICKEKCDSELPANPFDPNDKVGNEGYTIQRFIKSTDQLHYGIFFENVDTATTAAQVVTIVDTLDLTKVDKHSFYLESITAGEMLVVLPDSVRLQNLDSIYKEKPVNGTYVRMQATFDTTTGIIKFVLTSLDTTTLQPVTGVFEGFLPPDTTKFEGNGLVSYKILPVVNIPGNTVITNKAYIIFDTNPAIVTGTWFNTIDGTKPSSQVNTLPAITYDSSFTVSWTGIDNEAGIRAYDIYYKTSGNTEFIKWKNFTSQTSAVFEGIWDSTYQFYSIAYDSVLNMEESPLNPDAFTTVKKPIGDSICIGSSISLNSDASGTVTGYQWQLDSGTGYTDLANSSFYTGVNTNILNIISAPSSFYGFKYRCIVDKTTNSDTSIVHVLHFVNRWTGALNTAWENVNNWSCNSLPDGNTDVIINGIITNAPVISSEAICRSLFLNSSIAFRVVPNYKLTITH